MQFRQDRRRTRHVRRRYDGAACTRCPHVLRCHAASPVTEKSKCPGHDGTFFSTSRESTAPDHTLLPRSPLIIGLGRCSRCTYLVLRLALLVGLLLFPVTSSRSKRTMLFYLCLHFLLFGGSERFRGNVLDIVLGRSSVRIRGCIESFRVRE